MQAFSISSSISGLSGAAFIGVSHERFMWLDAPFLYHCDLLQDAGEVHLVEAELEHMCLGLTPGLSLAVVRISRSWGIPCVEGSPVNKAARNPTGTSPDVTWALRLR
jgi:hypothetical protein